MRIIRTAETASWAFNTEKVTDRVIVLVVGEHDLLLAIDEHLPL